MRLADLITPDGHIDRAKLHLEIVKHVTEAVGYDFDIERLERIAENSQEIMDIGAPFPWAYAEALDVELLLYGDPLFPNGPLMKGFINEQQT